MILAAPVAGDDSELNSTVFEAGLPVEDLSDRGRTFFRFEQDGITIGFGGFERYGADVLIRSVVVMPELRGAGYGRHLTEALLNEAKRAGSSNVYLLTTNASGYFTRLGFELADRSQAPRSILDTRQATSICSTASLLSRPI